MLAVIYLSKTGPGPLLPYLASRRQIEPLGRRRPLPGSPQKTFLQHQLTVLTALPRGRTTPHRFAQGCAMSAAEEIIIP